MALLDRGAACNDACCPGCAQAAADCVVGSRVLATFDLIPRIKVGFGPRSEAGAVSTGVKMHVLQTRPGAFSTFLTKRSACLIWVHAATLSPSEAVLDLLILKSGQKCSEVPLGDPF